MEQKKWAAKNNMQILTSKEYPLFSKDVVYFTDLLDMKFGSLGQSEVSNYSKDLKARFEKHECMP